MMRVQYGFPLLEFLDFDFLGARAMQMVHKYSSGFVSEDIQAQHESPQRNMSNLKRSGGASWVSFGASKPPCFRVGPCFLPCGFGLCSAYFRLSTKIQAFVGGGRDSKTRDMQVISQEDAAGERLTRGLRTWFRLSLVWVGV